MEGNCPLSYSDDMGLPLSDESLDAVTDSARNALQWKELSKSPEPERTASNEAVDRRSRSLPGNIQLMGQGHLKFLTHEGERSVPNSLSKKRRAKTTQYACPYRKRNPFRFNIRDYNACVAPYPGFTQLKFVLHPTGKRRCSSTCRHLQCFRRHVIVFHRNRLHICPRCWVQFQEEAELLRHLRAAELCCLRSSSQKHSHDPEDGISAETVEVLRSRQLDCKVNNWRQLWLLLFPGDKDSDIPSSGSLFCHISPSLLSKNRQIDQLCLHYRFRTGDGSLRTLCGEAALLAYAARPPPASRNTRHRRSAKGYRRHLGPIFERRSKTDP